MEEKIYDIIIIGGGPAGLTAGLYGSRSKLEVLVIEKEAYGGQISTTSEVDNYPGSMDNCTGPLLSEKIKAQAEEFGTVFSKDEILKVDLKSQIKTVEGKKQTYSGRTVILATGAAPRLGGFKNETDFRGRGVSYCATCDGNFFEGLDIAVIGGGDSAITEALYLTKFASTVTIIHRRDKLRAAKSLSEKAFNHKKIKFIWDSVVDEVTGEGIVESLKVKNVKTEQELLLEVNGVFVYTGLNPITEFVKEQIELDQFGYIPTDENMRTNIEGVYAAGDVRVKKLRQVVTATADGAIAAFDAEEYINEKFNS